MTILKSIALIAFIAFSLPVFSVDESALTKKWQHTDFGLYLDANEAYQLKSNRPKSVLLLDVRTVHEVNYTGMANLVDANIPYRLDSLQWKLKKNPQKGTFKKIINPNFAQAVENLLAAKGLNKNAAIIIMCKAGSRAPFAAKALFNAGFKKVYTQIEGFEGSKAKKGKYKGHRVVDGWKNQGLPWSYDLPTQKMYFNFAP